MLANSIMPFYAKNGILIYCGDCREILKRIKPDQVDLVLTDPPYGINLNTKGKSRTAAAQSNDYEPVCGDDVPFDPAHLLKYKRLILFGANYYAQHLPPSASWIIWDKRDHLTGKREVGFNNSADVEVAWSNLGGPARIFYHRWMGMIKASERQDKRVHPTQKPIELMQELLMWRYSGGGFVLDPYMGSGPTLIAARRLNLPAIGIEISEKYCEIAANRLEKEGASAGAVGMQAAA